MLPLFLPRSCSWPNIVPLEPRLLRLRSILCRVCRKIFYKNLCVFTFADRILWHMIYVYYVCIVYSKLQNNIPDPYLCLPIFIDQSDPSPLSSCEYYEWLLCWHYPQFWFMVNFVHRHTSGAGCTLLNIYVGAPETEKWSDKMPEIIHW